MSIQHLNSYPNVCALGHMMVENVLEGRVIIQEKIDGSQFSFSSTGDDPIARSKNVQIHIGQSGSNFTLALNWLKENFRKLNPAYVYRGEYLQSPKHNTLKYARVPKNNIILFDICYGVEKYLPYEEVQAEAERIGLEVVPRIAEGVFTEADIEAVKGEWLARESILGGTTVEGVVIKNYGVFTPDKKVAMAKIVRTDFQEMNATNWRKTNPTLGDVIQDLIDTYRTEARWRKAVQHLRDSGSLQGTMRDIPALMNEVSDDVLKEEKEEILRRLLSYAFPKIKRGITKGIPEWYRDQIEEKEVQE